MNIPSIVPQTFAHAPFSRTFAFHRRQEMQWKPEVDLVLHEQKIPERVPAPTEAFVQSVFQLLPSGWVGSVYFTWEDATHRWSARIPIREYDIEKVCGLWTPPCVQPVENVAS